MKIFTTSFLCMLMLGLGMLVTRTATAVTVDSILNLEEFKIIDRTTFEISQVEKASAVSDRLGTLLGKNDFKPVGMRVEAGTVLNLNVSLISGTDVPKLVTFTREFNDHLTYTLTPGDNSLTITKSGNVYLQFSSSEPSLSRKARVVFQSGFIQVPFYLMGITTNAEWQTMLANDTISDGILFSNRTFVVLRNSVAETYRKKNQDLLLLNFDKIIKLESDLAGLDGSAPEHQPFIHSQLMFYDKDDGFPDASSYGRVRTPPGSVSWLGDPDYVLRKGGWGMFHEIGHHHQQKAWDWGSVNIEVLVNIHSLAAKRYFYPDNDGLSNESWSSVLTHLEGDSTKNYDANSTGLFERLGMFQQLWLNFGDTFFQNFYKKIREDRPNPKNRDDEIKLFMITASQIAGKNLNHFYRRWGLNAPQSHFDAVESLGLPEPALDPSTFSESWVVQKGSLKADTIVNAQSDVLIKVGALAPGGIEKVQFFKDGSLMGEDAVTPFRFHWASVPRGEYMIHAKVFANDGTFQTTEPVKVSTRSFFLEAPLDNATFYSGEDIEIVPGLPTYADNFDKVEYYQGNTKIGEVATHPFKFTWTAVPDGSYEIKAIVHYADSTKDTSAVVNIAVGGILATHDAYVRDGSYMENNFGDEPIVTIKNSTTGYNREGYFQFDLSKFDHVLHKASLELNIKSAGDDVTGTSWDLYYVPDDSWSENNITWKNKPNKALLLGTVDAKSDGKVSWDITDQVNNEIFTDKKMSLVVVATALSKNVNFHSGESNSVSLRPVIDFDATFTKTRSVIPAIEDSYVRRGIIYGDTNFNHEQALVVKNGAVFYWRESYLKFDLSDHVKTLDSAFLELNISNASSSLAGTNWNLYYVSDDSWAEDSITWNNKPSGGVLLGTIAGNTSGVARWNITNQLNDEILNDGTLSLLIVAEGNTGYVSFYSREVADESLRPVIRTVKSQLQGLEAAGDAYVRGGTYRNTNYGSERRLIVKNSSSSEYRREAYLKFDLSDRADSVNRAVLNLNIDQADSGIGDIIWELYHVSDDSWTENGITWNNKPSGGTLLGTVNGKNNGLATWDITDQVNAEISGDKTLSLLVVSSQSGSYGVNFNSRETEDSDKRPFITIVESESNAAPASSTASLGKEKVLLSDLNNGLKEDENLAESKSILIYPNPAQEKVRVISKDQVNSIKLINLTGQVVQARENINSGDFELNLIGVSPGVYFIHLITDTYSTTHKLLIN